MKVFNTATASLLANQLIVCLTVIFSAFSGAKAELSFTATATGTYYPELPIHLTVTVSNESTGAVSVNSVGDGSPWVTPVEIKRQDGTKVNIAHISKCLWRQDVKLVSMASLTGRIDIAPYFGSDEADLLTGLPSGLYFVTLQYCPRIGSKTRFVTSPIQIRVIDPPLEMAPTKQAFIRLRQIATTQTNDIPVEVTAISRDPNNPYWIAFRFYYACWLSRVNRQPEAISMLQDLLSIQNSPADTYRVDVQLELAQCYMALHQQSDARRLCESIKDKSDVAFGMLRMLTRPSNEN